MTDGFLWGAGFAGGVIAVVWGVGFIRYQILWPVWDRLTHRRRRF